jgi:hypothetical protein
MQVVCRPLFEKKLPNVSIGNKAGSSFSFASLENCKDSQIWDPFITFQICQVRKSKQITRLSCLVYAFAMKFTHFPTATVLHGNGLHFVGPAVGAQDTYDVNTKVIHIRRNE